MTGYHYTVESHWTEIRRKGLMPSEVSWKHLSVPRDRFAAGTVTGIWLWKRKPKSHDHIGNILRTAAMHNELRVVQLEVEYEASHLFRVDDGGCLDITHSEIKVGNLSFGVGVSSIFIGRTIRPKNIRLIGKWDLKKILK